MSLLNKLFKKNEPAKKPAAAKKIAAEAKPQSVVRTPAVPEKIKSSVLISPLTTEKAVSSQSLSPYGRSPVGRNKYIFKVAPKANKIDIIKAVSKNYNVKAISANIINIPRKARQVGKTRGFKSGFKKAVVTLAKGQTIEIK